MKVPLLGIVVNRVVVRPRTDGYYGYSSGYGYGYGYGYEYDDHKEPREECQQAEEGVEEEESGESVDSREAIVMSEQQEGIVPRRAA